MGMTPMHMACSAEAMECLYMFGADITATDDSGRSPLFVACAMNRDSCAEFLVTSLDQIEQSILLKDHRGDTPLHAAACNGSVECLLLLLQFGIDPRVTNDKGLKAVDLAIKNKQKQCRQLLAEYHLHYGTSSDFDSVLFLATLEVTVCII
jgi:ankyrin repeat protein